jgi:hypothetical protein
MTRYNADLEVIKGLRQALTVFTAQQVEALEAVEREIAEMMESLDESEQYWRDKAERRSHTLQECRIAQMVAPVDCSREEAELREAEEKLNAVVERRYRVGDAVIEYHAASQRFGSALENEPPRACAYLDERITALEAYQGAVMLSNQPSSPSAPPNAPLAEPKESKPSAVVERGASDG